MSKSILEQILPKTSDTSERYKPGKRVSMETFIYDYVNSKIDIVGDFEEVIENRDVFIDYTFTKNHFKFVATRMIPEVLIHSKKQDERIVRDHYDRGRDFFRAFLGERMVYTAGMWYDLQNESLEDSQDRKMESVCRKLGLSAGKKHLDIGCGWGTLVCYAAKHFQTNSIGITIAEDGAGYGNQLIEDQGVSERAEILRMDYRDIPMEKYHAISTLEMIEHVGLKNYKKFTKQLYNLMTDDGVLYLQQAGLRANPGLHKKGEHWEDLVWGLFMNEFIFSGADASTPLAFMVKNLQEVGFEVANIENLGIHYSHTISAWYKNWMSNESKIKESYGEWWFRTWQVFLRWSVIIGRQGSSTCYGIVAYKNLNRFNRDLFIGKDRFGYAPSNKILKF